MVALLTLFTFAAAIGLALIYKRFKARGMLFEMEPLAPAIQEVEGFNVPEELYFHNGHTWLRVDGVDKATVGIDDFASRILGSVDSLILPNRGEDCEQGEVIGLLKKRGKSIGVISPVKGVVISANEDIVQDKGLLSRDPYGRGWLFKVKSTDLKRCLRNLMRCPMVEAWMEESARKLKSMFNLDLGLLYQDGGTPVSDLIESLGEEDWSLVLKEFFLLDEPGFQSSRKNGQ